jgi:hypothetical protein
MNSVSAKGLAILSGSPQVEKSILGYGLAVKLAERGVGVLYIDLLFLQEESCFGDFPRCDLRNIATLDRDFVRLTSTDESGFDIVRCYSPGVSGIDEKVLESLTDFIGDSSLQYDSIIISAPCGINPLAVLAAGLCEEVVLTIDPEASSVASAYCLLKTLTAEGMGDRMITAFLNVDSSEQANSLKKRFDYLTEDFLNLKLRDGGYACSRGGNDDEGFFAIDKVKKARGFVESLRFESMRMFHTETKEDNSAGIYPSNDEPGRYKTG